MKTIIAPVYLHEELKIKLLKETNQNYILDTKFIDFDSFKTQNLEKGDDSFLKAVKTLQAVDITILKEMIEYPTFAMEIYNFYRKAINNELDLCKFPAKNRTYKELKDLFLSLKSLNLTKSGFNQIKHLFKGDFSNTYLYNINLDIEDLPLINHLKSLGLKIKELPTLTPTITAYNTLNKHQEIEAIAQEIINNNLPIAEINIICCNPEYPSLINQVFSMYHLPVGYTSVVNINDANIKFKALIDLYLNPNIENYRKATVLNCFLKKANKEINTYLSDFVTDFSELRSEFSYYQNLEVNIDTRDLRSIIDLEIKANLVHSENLVGFLTLIESSDLKEAIINAFELVKANTDLKQVKKLKSSIEKYFNEISISNINFFFATLKDNYQDFDSYQNKICVTNLNNQVSTRKYSFLIGADQSHFPNFTIAKGYFNQDVLEEIGYYSKTELFDHYNKKIQWVYSSASTKLYLFSSIGKYDGKAIENSLELEKIATFVNYDLISNDFQEEKSHSLTVPNAIKIFSKNNTVYGSISSFEKYYNCPYSYFLNYGLKLYDNSLIEIQANTLGTVAHYMFESLVKKYGKEYALVNFDELLQESNTQFGELKKVFRNRTLELDSIQLRFIKDLSQGFKFYQSMEAATKFNPTSLEKEVSSIMAESNGFNLQVKGFIDRVDTYGNNFRIIDYKSNAKVLSASKIEQGVQLQLPTYTYILKEQEHLNPVGTYYSNFLAKKAKYSDYNFSISKLLEASDYRVANEELINSQRLSGFTFDLSLDLDDGNHIKGVNNKKELTVFGGADSYDNLESGILEIYHDLLDKLLIGNINLDPLKGACTYCNYRSICNFKGRMKEFNTKICNLDIKNKEAEEVEE